MTTNHAGQPKRERKLPVQQLAILATCRFAEPIAFTSLFPYLPEMIRSFGIPQNEVGKWAGICSAMFSLCQAAVGIPWGRFADRYGRKPCILLGLTCTMTATLLWGFSTSLPMAIIARSIAGSGGGIVGIIRTTVAELVPFKELQPRAFSIMPLVWSIGSVFGPAFGGALANPFNVYPGQIIENPSLLQRFPYALPNIVSACIFLFGVVIGILFLEETLETKQQTRDYGLVLGNKLKGACRKCFRRIRSLLHIGKVDLSTEDEHEPLIKSTEDEENTPVKSTEPDGQAPSYREVLNKQAILNLLVYTLLALHNTGFDQLIPVFAQYPPLQSRADSTFLTLLSAKNPLQFVGGFGLNHMEIGMMNTVYGIVGMFIQFSIFPPLCRKFGVLNCLRVCVCVYPVLYLIIPFTALLPTRNTQIAGCLAVMFVKCFCSIFSVPASTILLTNCASSLRVLGTLNGFATTFSALGRAAGPAIGGLMFTIGVEEGYVIASWWTFCAFSIVAAIPVYWLVEGEGFGGDHDHISDEEEETDAEDASHAKTITPSDSRGIRGTPNDQRAQTQREEEEVLAEAEYGDLAILTRSSTLSSALSISLGSDEYSTPARSRETSVDQAQASPSDMQVGSMETVRRRPSASDQNAPQRRKVIRRTSLPIGMGRQGISRRYSSNLGQSFTSQGGWNT